MVEFGAAAVLEVELDPRSLAAAERELESLGDVSVGVDAGAVGARPDGGMTPASMGGLSQTSGDLTELASERNEVLEEILDEIEEGNLFGGGGDGLLGGLFGGGAVPLTGAASALTGAAASLGGSATALVGSAASLSGAAAALTASDLLSGESVDVEEPEWIPLDVNDPSPLEVEAVDDIPVENPGTIGVEDPSPLGVDDPSPLDVTDPSPLDVTDPSPLEVEDVGRIPVEEPDPIDVNVGVGVSTGPRQSDRQPDGGGSGGGFFSGVLEELDPTQRGPFQEQILEGAQNFQDRVTGQRSGGDGSSRTTRTSGQVRVQVSVNNETNVEATGITEREVESIVDRELNEFERRLSRSLGGQNAPRP